MQPKFESMDIVIRPSSSNVDAALGLQYLHQDLQTADFRTFHLMLVLPHSPSYWLWDIFRTSLPLFSNEFNALIGETRSAFVLEPTSMYFGIN